MKKLYHSLCRVETVVCGVIFVLLVLLVFLSAFLRFFRVSMSWNIDLALFLLAWTAFLGADIAWRNGQLVGIDLVVRNFPKLIQTIIKITVYIVIACTLLLVFLFGMRLAWTDRLRLYQSLPIPYSLTILSLALTALSMVLSTVLKIRRCICDSLEESKGRVLV